MPCALPTAGLVLLGFSAPFVNTGRACDIGQAPHFPAVTVTITAVPATFVVDTPKPSAMVSRTFDVGGWTVDTRASSGRGVDAVQIWAYPVAGGAPLFVGTPAQTPRPDVAAVVGRQFLNSGFLLGGATLPLGTYDLVIFAHSTVTGAFDSGKVVRITVR